VGHTGELWWGERFMQRKPPHVQLQRKTLKRSNFEHVENAFRDGYSFLWCSSAAVVNIMLHLFETLGGTKSLMCHISESVFIDDFSQGLGVECDLPRNAVLLQYYVN
jgi:hypothetical protein